MHWKASRKMVPFPVPLADGTQLAVSDEQALALVEHLLPLLSLPETMHGSRAKLSTAPRSMRWQPRS